MFASVSCFLLKSDTKESIKISLLRAELLAVHFMFISAKRSVCLSFFTT